MKNLIALLLILTFSISLNGNNEPVSPTTMHVYAYSGLKLRTQPTLNSEVVKVIPYGDKVTLIAKSGTHQVIEWMSGEWVKVTHGTDEGFIFEGFISELPIPNYKFEMSQNDLDLTYPLLAWAEYHFDEVKETDTIEKNDSHQIVQHLEKGITLTRKDSQYDFRVMMELSDTKIEDAYNLMKSMLLTKAERLTFENKTIFIHDNEGLMHRIKVNVDYPVEIKRMKNGNIKISVKSYHHGCDIF